MANRTSLDTEVTITITLPQLFELMRARAMSDRVNQLYDTSEEPSPEVCALWNKYAYACEMSWVEPIVKQIKQDLHDINSVLEKLQ